MMPALTLRSALLLTALCALTACGDRVEQAPVPLAASGPSEVKVEGVSYLADLQPTGTGSTLRVTRDAPPMTYDEGALAKQVEGHHLRPWRCCGVADSGPCARLPQ